MCQEGEETTPGVVGVYFRWSNRTNGHHLRLPSLTRSLHLLLFLLPVVFSLKRFQFRINFQFYRRRWTHNNKHNSNNNNNNNNNNAVFFFIIEGVRLTGCDRPARRSRIYLFFLFLRVVLKKKFISGQAGRVIANIGSRFITRLNHLPRCSFCFVSLDFRPIV